MMKKSIWFRLLASALTVAMLVSLAACTVSRKTGADEVNFAQWQGKTVKKGDVISFGKRGSDAIEWVICKIDSREMNGETHAVATLMTKCVEENPIGWGKSGGYMVSNLAGTCENNFKATMKTSLSAEQEKLLLKTTITLPEGGEAQVTYYAPSKADIEAMLKSDALKDFVSAPPSDFARKMGIGLSAGKDGASYYLRDFGVLEAGIQYACGVTGDGEISEKFGMDITRNVGTRVCVRVDLGVYED